MVTHSVRSLRLARIYIRQFDPDLIIVLAKLGIQKATDEKNDDYDQQRDHAAVGAIGFSHMVFVTSLFLLRDVRNRLRKHELRGREHRRRRPAGDEKSNQCAREDKKREGKREHRTAAQRGAAQRRGGLSSGSGEINSPMPGLIVAVQVEVGQTVEAGQTIIILESMKMQNELKAPIAGVVETIHCKPTQTVDKRDLLVVIKTVEEG